MYRSVACTGASAALSPYLCARWLNERCLRCEAAGLDDEGRHQCGRELPQLLDALGLSSGRDLTDKLRAYGLPNADYLQASYNTIRWKIVRQGHFPVADLDRGRLKHAGALKYALASYLQENPPPPASSPAGDAPPPPSSPSSPAAAAAAAAAPAATPPPRQPQSPPGAQGFKRSPPAPLPPTSPARARPSPSQPSPPAKRARSVLIVALSPCADAFCVPVCSL